MEIEGDSEAELALDPVKVRTGVERHHLETALAVQFHGSFGKAALALGMLSSTVGARVRNLEFQLGCIRLHDVSTAAVLHMVGAGRGISLCLDSVLGDHYAGTVFRELHGASGPEYVTSFACWFDDEPHPALDRLLRRLLPRATP